MRREPGRGAGAWRAPFAGNPPRCGKTRRRGRRDVDDQARASDDGTRGTRASGHRRDGRAPPATRSQLPDRPRHTAGVAARRRRRGLRGVMTEAARHDRPGDPLNCRLLDSAVSSTGAIDPRLDAMVEAARAGGAVALEHYRRGFSVTLKADRSPVTEADHEAERAIGTVLRARFPDHGTLGEELGETGPRDRRFIVDPIDGTRNFVRRIPTWAVLIGLEEDGAVVAGVVYQPATGVLHTAVRGQGAWRDGERLRVSPVDALERALVVHSSVNFLKRSRYWDGFLHLADRTQVQRGLGDFSAYLWV